MRYFFVSLIVMIAGAAHAQTKPRVTAGLEAAITKGNSDNSQAFFLTSGIAYKSWTTGAGAGVDGYVFRSLPLFIDVKKSFGHRRLQPFVNASAGININETKDEQKFLYSSYLNVNYRNGFYVRTIAGVSLPVYKRLRVFIDGGYSYKTTSVDYTSFSYSPDPAETTSTDIYRFHRWSLSIGFWF